MFTCTLITWPFRANHESQNKSEIESLWFVYVLTFNYPNYRVTLVVADLG